MQFTEKDSKVEDLLMKDRVDFIYPADYSENTGLDLTVKNIIRKWLSAVFCTMKTMSRKRNSRKIISVK